MLVALLGFAGVALSSLCVAIAAIYRVRTVDKRAADTDEVGELWKENRALRREIEDMRGKWARCQQENLAMKIRISELERIVGSHG